MDEASVYLGTYQPRGRDALFHLRFSARDGSLRVHGAVSTVDRPSFLAPHPGRRYLYVASEAAGGAEGEVGAFAVDAVSGELTPLGGRPAHGRSTCHVAVDPGGRWLVAANYGSPTVVMYPLAEDGTIGETPTIVRHSGSSVHPRQREPHPHSANIDPTGRFVYCPDLGLDRVVGYRLDAAAGRLAADLALGAEAVPGAGPRHLAFHPSRRFVYVVNEINSTVAAHAWDPASGALRRFQTVSALPAGFDGQSTCAEVAVHPSGRFVYASNRGHDSIAVFGVDDASGRLAPLGHQSTGGRTPRNFVLDPSGTFLLAENQDSDCIVTLAIDADTGALQPTGQRLEVPTPVCLRFAPAAG